ncbi:hypothetical protein GPECTOR_63g25 [Gonium pectorale]|uniref:Uncharacterized protein n=1 Tax=Gonium pectorale TaxID=33097 RepID=A0A150G4B1_GONPE|nr:hypothetical protein GPECTOR_63g25 [Gonium pectorale]|eukprot:KXZ44697.1 hypothetical protein GPECTOR_63g25 [Gonium pectorale]
MICPQGDDASELVEETVSASFQRLAGNQPKQLQLITTIDTPILDGLTHVTLTDKLLTSGAARALLSAAPSLRHLELGSPADWHPDSGPKLGSDRDYRAEWLAKSHQQSADALASGLPLVLRERAASLTALQLSCCNAALPDSAASALGACTRLQQLGLRLPLGPNVVDSVVALEGLRSLTLANPGGDGCGGDLRHLSALSSLSALSQLVFTCEIDRSWDEMRLDDDAYAIPSDPAPLSGLLSLVDLSLHGAVLDGEGLRCLASLTALTRLHAFLLKAKGSPAPGAAQHAGGGPSPAPLSWSLPPALRHLCLDQAEVPAMAALRPPASLEVVEMSEPTKAKHCRLGLFFHPTAVTEAEGWIVEDEDTTFYKLPGGCGPAMRGAVAFLAGRLQPNELCVCIPDTCAYLTAEGDPAGHAAWIRELRPLRLKSLCLCQLALGAGDLVELVVSAPDLEELVLNDCHVAAGALPLLNRLSRLKCLTISIPRTWHHELAPGMLRSQLLALCATDTGPEGAVTVEITDYSEEDGVWLEEAADWVHDQLRVLGCRRRVFVGIW